VAITAMAVEGAAARPMHCIAVTIALIPALSSWVLNTINTTLQAAGTSLGELYAQGNNTDGHTIQTFTDQRFYLEGVISLSQGFVVSSIVICAMCMFLFDKLFITAAIWAIVGALLSMVGLIHAYEIDEVHGVVSVYGVAAAPKFGAMYLATAAMLVLASLTSDEDIAKQDIQLPLRPFMQWIYARAGGETRSQYRSFIAIKSEEDDYQGPADGALGSRNPPSTTSLSNEPLLAAAQQSA